MVEWHRQLNGHEFKQTPGDSEGQGGLACYSPWGCKESEITEYLRSEDRGVAVDREELATLIDNARAAAGIEAMEWETDDGERLLKTTIDFVRDDFLPTLDGREYAASMPAEMGAFLSDCLQAVSGCGATAGQSSSS